MRTRLTAAPACAALRYSAGSVLARSGLPRPPLCSLADGAAGIAYFLLRYAAVTRDRRALDAAADWVARSLRDLTSSAAFITRSRSSRREQGARPSSLHFGEAGMWCVAALVAAAGGDETGVERAVGRFAAIARACPEDALDAVSGAASLLLGASTMIEELGDPAASQLLLVGEQLNARLTAAAAEREQNGTDLLRGWLGAAHGWCGLAHAQLRWCQATSANPGPELEGLLQRLARARLASGLWPRREGQPDGVWSGWCHGSAGWVQLWTLAFELLDDVDLLKLAGPVGAHAVGGSCGVGVCCGQAGQAYAALALYRATGIKGWLRHATNLIAQSVKARTGERFPELSEDSLWYGALGVALLATEIAEPWHSAMPLYRALPSPT